MRFVQHGAIAVVSDETAKLSTADAFDISTPEDERALAMHRERWIKDGYRRIPSSADAEMGIQEIDVNDLFGNANPKDMPMVSVLGS